MKAIEIYQTYSDEGEGLPMGAAAWHEYYVQLRDALMAELKDTGSSELVSTLLRSRGEEIQYLAAAAVYDCYYVLVLGEPPADPTCYIPSWGKEKRVEWTALDRSPEGYRVRLDGALREKLLILRSVARQMHDLRMMCISPTAEAASERSLESYQKLYREQLIEISELQERNTQLTRKLEALRAGYIDEQLRLMTAERKRQQEAELAQAYEKQKQEADEAFRLYFAGDLTAHRRRRQDQARDMGARHEKRMEEYADMRGDLHRALAAIQAAVDGQLGQWEARLCAADHRLLAQSYLALYRLAENELAALITGAACEHAPQSVMQLLAGFDAQLHQRLMQLEAAMAQLGMAVLRPEPGDAYDENLHIPGETITGVFQPEGAVIREMALPGVVVRSSGEALVKAEVLVESKAP